MKIFVMLCCLLVAASLSGEALSSDGFFERNRRVRLIDLNGQKIDIGELIFSAKKLGVVAFKFKPNYDIFTDFFLSMKEMKCLEGPELWCHIPYPHENPQTIEEEDYRWLEHKLIFMFKDKKSFGANFWNGIYYTLKPGNGRLLGTAQHVDLNILAAPPEDVSIPPIGEYDLELVDPKTRWLPSLVIE